MASEPSSMGTQNPNTMEARDKVEAELSRIIDTRIQAIQEQLRVELSSFKAEVVEALMVSLGFCRPTPMVVAQPPGLSSVQGQNVQIPSEELGKIAEDSDVVKTDPNAQVEINQVPADTMDEDEILESEFFDSLSQGNHYQYDTAPAFVRICNICHLDIEAGQGWRCEVCPEYDVCNACYQKDGGVDHPHKLTNHPSIADRDAQNKEARQMRVVQLRKMLELLVHASRCRSPQCQYPNCRKVKGLFRHGIQCKRRASGGCLLCKKMWYLLQLHARACKESECHVPRCRDLREHLRRLQQQAESRRRAAVMEMMRQNAAEAAGNSA